MEPANGSSFRIFETHIDFKDDGKTSVLTKGPNVTLDKAHPWNIALRIAGWSYGNCIELADGRNFQGKLSIRANRKNSTITDALPKKYITIESGYKPYIAILSGSQDGSGEGYWRKVGITAGEWQLGGANPDAFNAGVSPNVSDILCRKTLRKKKS